MKTGNQIAYLACLAVVACCAFVPANNVRAQASPANPNARQAQAEPSTRPRMTTTPSQTETRAGAQDARPAPDAAPASTRLPDLSIDARVTARELKFRVVPNPSVEFTGKPRRDTVWDAVRQNLPQSVRPGETYRDIGITLRITSVFADIDRIVSEALGEIPLSEDTSGAQDFSTHATLSRQHTTAREEENTRRSEPSIGASEDASQPLHTPHASPLNVPLKQTRTTRRGNTRRGTRR